MPVNLEQKISLLVRDLEDLPKEEAKKRIHQFITSEIGFHKQDHFIDNYELTSLKSRAVGIMNEMTIQTTRDMGLDNSRQQAYCYLNAVIGFLRLKGLIDFKVLYTKKRKTTGS